jgi:hypothetical protein
MSTDLNGEPVRLAALYDDCRKRLNSAIYVEASEEYGLRLTDIKDKLELWEQDIGLRHNGRNLLDQVDEAGAQYSQQDHYGRESAESELYTQTRVILDRLTQAIKGCEVTLVER